MVSSQPKSLNFWKSSLSFLRMRLKIFTKSLEQRQTVRSPYQEENSVISCIDAFQGHTRWKKTLFSIKLHHYHSLKYFHLAVRLRRFCFQTLRHQWGRTNRISWVLDDDDNCEWRVCRTKSHTTFQVIFLQKDKSHIQWKYYKRLCLCVCIS